MKILKFGFLFCSLLYTNAIFAHVGEHNNERSASTYIIKKEKVEGHFLMQRDGKVFIQQKNGEILSAALTDFSFDNQTNLSQKIAELKKINTNDKIIKVSPIAAKGNEWSNFSNFLLVILILSITTFYCIKTIKPVFALTSITLITLLIACKSSEVVEVVDKVLTFSKTYPGFLEKIFAPYNAEVKTRYDNTYFYVETEGIPKTHNMMVGITSWQQQVPLPQGYTGTNAWSIPLQPVYAETPLSLKTNFMKGAVAIAPNGIPIFNPLNNRGEDAFLFGELDQWGGHCGRADDYHYHIAPLHFEATAGNNPIAMALDGFPIYGSKEPDGTTMKTLDEYHGHVFGTGYHYHSETKYPYFIGAMRGKVNINPATTAPENEIAPQAKTVAIRPGLEPLKGATISDFKSTGTNAYSLEYTLNSKKAFVNYTWNINGVYTFTFIDTDGKSTTSSYTKK